MRKLSGRAASIGLAAATAISFGVLDPHAARAQAAQAATLADQDQGAPCFHVVEPGDTLSLITRRLLGIDAFSDVHAANIDVIGPDPNLIEVGMRLRLPCAGDVAAPEAASVAAPPRPAPVDGGTAARVNIAFVQPEGPPTALQTLVIQPYLAEMERVTEGRVRVTQSASVTSIPQAVLGLVQIGGAGGGFVDLRVFEGASPLSQLSLRPMIGGRAAQTALALWRTHAARLAAGGEFAGVRLLGFVGAPPAQIWRLAPGETAPEPPEGAAEFLALAQDVIARGSTGAPPVLAAASFAEARASGLADRAEAVIEIDGGVYAPAAAVFIALEIWEALSPRDRAAIEAISGEALAARSAALEAPERIARAAVLAAGAPVVPADLDLLAELQGAAGLSWEAWIGAANRAGVDGYRAFNTFTDEIARARGG